jgi:hypothetical protein
MNKNVYQWDHDQFVARVEKLAVDGYISRVALRSLMDNQFASPAIKTAIRESLSNHLNKQALHLKYDLGIKTYQQPAPSVWTEAEFMKRLAGIVDKQHYIKNDERWTLETISRNSLRDLLEDPRIPEQNFKNISLLMERYPGKKLFKLDEVESYLRKKFDN